MPRITLLSLKLVNGVLYVFILWIFLFSLDPIFKFANIMPIETTVLQALIDTVGSLFYSLRNVIIYVIYFILIMVAYGLSLLINLGFGAISGFQTVFMSRFVELFFISFLNKWFVFPTGQAPRNIFEIPSLMLEEFDIFISDFYVMTFMILVTISIIYAVRAALQNEPKYNLVVIGTLILMVVIPLMILGFRDMLRLFTFQIELLEDLKNPVDLDIIINQNAALDFFSYFADFITNPVTIMAVLAYIYLEISFQINYVNVVTKPSLERSERLEAQLTILQKEALLITANAEKIKEEARDRRIEMEIEDKDDVSKFMTKGGQSYSYVKRMIERKKLEEEEKKLVRAASKTRRLGRYIERLFREDREAADTITARSSAPEPRGLIMSTIVNFLFRVFLLILLSFIILHPNWFFVNVFNLPPAITESVAMYSPEVVITIMAPIILIFPLISQIISYVKHRSLIIRLKQEGRIKQILASVGDYVVQDEEEEEEEGEAFTPGGSTTEPATEAT